MHTIRLRGPWEAEPLPDGLVRYTRRFHRPTGLECGERVWLIVEDAASVIRAVLLNGQPLPMAAGRFDVTELLAPGNQLQIISSPDSDTGSLARLEIS